MKEKRRLQSYMLRGVAEEMGLVEGAKLLIRERSMLKDGAYITRKIRKGTVLKRYEHHFYCLMSDGTKESFRYNEFLGDEARLIRLAGNKRVNAQKNDIACA